MGGFGWDDLQSFVWDQEDQNLIFTLKLLEVEKGSMYHKIPHDEFLPGFECTDIRKAPSSWEIEEGSHEEGISTKWSD